MVISYLTITLIFQDGQLGFPDNATITTPAPLSSVGKHILQVCAVRSHSFVLDRDGSVYAFGMNVDGMLGLGFKSKEERIPIIITALRNVKVVQVAGGGEHTMVVSDDGTVYAFGSNNVFHETCNFSFFNWG